MDGGPPVAGRLTSFDQSVPRNKLVYVCFGGSDAYHIDALIQTKAC